MRSTPALSGNKSNDEGQTKRRRRRWPWLLVIIPPAVIVLALAGATARYGYQTVRQAAILGYTLLFPYTPSTASNTLAGPWRTLPQPGAHIGSLRIAADGLRLPIVQGTYPHQVSDAGHFAGSTLPGEGGDSVLITESPRLHPTAIRPGTAIEWMAPQGVFSYQVTRTGPISSLSQLSGIDREMLTVVEETMSAKGATRFYAIFARPDFASRS